MSRIRMRVSIHNESHRTLRLAKVEVAWGEWTPGWSPGEHPVITPGQTAEFRGEGDLAVVPTTGTETRVWYDVEGTDGQFYIHSNSPLSESQYGNTFHVWAPEGLEAAYTGGQGHHAHLVIHFRETARRSVPRFKPSVNGFRFPNSGWSSDLPVMTVGHVWNALLRKLGPVGKALGIVPVADDWLPFTDASQGLCGGMVFAVRDYHEATLYPPTDTALPNRADHPLFTFIRDRLVDSFDLDGTGSRWLAYSAPTYPDGDEGALQSAGLARGRSWVTYRDEWPKIREDILAGRPSPIGLVQTTSLALGDNHQNLAYAYRQSGQLVDLWVYDPNLPNADDLILRFDIGDTTGRVHVQRVADPQGKGTGWGTGSYRDIRAILRLEGYVAKLPPFGSATPPRKPTVTLNPANKRLHVASGATTHTQRTPCGDTLRSGHWVTWSTCEFRADHSGFGPSQPRVEWSVDGVAVPTGAGSITVVRDGRARPVTTTSDTEHLQLASTPGDTFSSTVMVTIHSADGVTKASASAAFEAVGSMDGPHPEDLLALGKCLKSLIPHLPLDLADLHFRTDSPRPNWEILQSAINRLNVDRGELSPPALRAIEQTKDIFQRLELGGRIGDLGRRRAPRLDTEGIGRINRPT